MIPTRSARKRSNRTGMQPRVWAVCGCLFVAALIVMQAGCQMTRERAFQRMAYVASFSPHDVVTVKPVKKDLKSRLVPSVFIKKSQPSERTQQLLHQYGLLEHYKRDSARIIRWLNELAANQPTMEEVHALAELAEIEANWHLTQRRSDDAMNYYTTAVIHSYQFLFAPRLDIKRNAYDPQFRSICDIYNRSLEGMLRQACRDGRLVPGQSISVGQGENQFEVEVEVAGRWKDQQFERFEMVSDYQTQGLTNRYHTYGLGVPLIAVRQQIETDAGMEKFYPPSLTLPMTAFGHLRRDQRDPDSGRLQAVLTLFDPLEQTVVNTDGQQVPLESDITTPLAHNLRDPIVHSGVLETVSLINAELAPELYGMYMLEPFDPGKIPVVMVHGLWSSPMTWIHMFNDLRADPEIHANYQFWFYSYPTGQPFWYSARTMREDLNQIRELLDPSGTSVPLNRMVLVGHSMGGLISTMQSLHSEDRFWSMISETPISEFQGDTESLQRLKDTFYFEPGRSIARVITIATPFEGSEFANGMTQWASRQIFTLPNAQKNQIDKVVRANGDKIKSKELLTTATSLDSLESKAPIFEAIAQSTSASHVKHHNIYGRTEKKRWFTTRSTPAWQGDGVVSLESAQNPRAVSRYAVAADHSTIHQNEACIYEVKRILLEQLVELSRIQGRVIPELPME